MLLLTITGMMDWLGGAEKVLFAAFRRDQAVSETCARRDSGIRLMCVGLTLRVCTWLGPRYARRPFFGGRVDRLVK